MKTFIFLALFSTQVLAAGCLGLPKADKDACMQRIMNNLPPVNYEQAAIDKARYDAFQQRAANDRAVAQQQGYQEAVARQQQIAAQQQQLRQQQLAAEQQRRDAVAEATLQEVQRNNQLQQQAIQQQQQAAQQPAPRRAINCTNNGNGTSTCY